MNTTRAEHRRRAARRTRRRRTISAVIAVALIGAGVVAIALTRTPEAPLVADDTSVSAAPTETPTPTATPLTPAQALLAGSTDPHACAVSFAGDGIALDPQLQTQGARYQNLPIPRADGRVFAGWYDDATAASAMTQTARLNGADLVACTDRQRTLHAGWTTPEANAAEAAGIPILMYHQFTRNPNGEDNWLRLNYTYVGDFDAQMAHIQQSAFYLPTWDELSAFIDGSSSCRSTPWSSPTTTPTAPGSRWPPRSSATGSS